MMLRTWKFGRAIRATALAAALAIPALATLDFQQNLDWKYYFVVDWSSSTTAAGHLNFSTWGINEHPRGFHTKYIDLDVTTDFPGPGRGNCFELATMNGPSGNTADTEILVRQNDGSWARLSDDIPGSPNSKARIMLEDNIFTTQNPVQAQSPTKIRISAYNDLHEKEDFWVSLTLVGNLNEAQCTGDASKAAVFIDRHEGVRIIRAI